jgi:hypothetical protein
MWRKGFSLEVEQKKGLRACSQKCDSDKSEFHRTFLQNFFRKVEKLKEVDF